MDRDLRAAAAAVEAAAGAKGWNVKDLAAASDVDPATVTDFLAARRWPRMTTRAAIERALNWPGGSIAQIASGDAAPAASSSAQDMDPESLDLVAEVDELTREDREAIRAVVRQLASARRHSAPPEAHQSGELIDLARPPMPDLSRVAARHGESEGRRLREEQDRGEE